MTGQEILVQATYLTFGILFLAFILGEVISMAIRNEEIRSVLQLRKAIQSDMDKWKIRDSVCVSPAKTEKRMIQSIEIPYEDAAFHIKSSGEFSRASGWVARDRQNTFTTSSNLSVAASQFELNRRISFYNDNTGLPIFAIEGKCSIRTTDNRHRELIVTCKTDSHEYKRHIFGLSDNISYAVEQIDPLRVD